MPEDHLGLAAVALAAVPLLRQATTTAAAAHSTYMHDHRGLAVGWDAAVTQVIVGVPAAK